MDNPGLREHRVRSRGVFVPYGARLGRYGPVTDGDGDRYGDGDGDLPPEGAVFLDDHDVLQLHNEVIEKYQPRRHMWPFTYGIGIAGGLTAITGAACNAMFRKRMKLYQYKAFTTLAGTCVIPCLCAMLYQQNSVMNKILIGDYDCTLCLATKASCGQMLIAGVQTPMIAFFSCASVATFGFQYTMPAFSEPLAWMKKAHSLTKPYYGTIFILTLINGLYAGALAYQQLKTTTLIHKVLLGSDPQNSEESSDEYESYSAN